MRRRWFGVAIMLGLWACTAASGDTSDRGQVTVLLYHRFDEPAYPSTNTSSAVFAEQIDYLSREGYRFLTLAEFTDMVAGRRPFPDRAVLITIDDPYRSIYEHAFPLLREAGIPFVLFANASALYSGSPAYMDWEMVAEMTRAGAAIGNHSYYHPHLGRPEPGQNRAAYAAWVRADLAKARRALAAHGLDSDALAYPFGEYNEVVLEVAEELGFELMFTQDEGPAAAGTDARLIPRVPIVGANMTAERFVEKLQFAPLRLTSVSPTGIFLDQNPPGEFAAQLAEPARYDPGVVNMFVSEWGRLEAAYDVGTGRISHRPRGPLTRPVNRLIVTARERFSGRYAIAARLYLLPYEAFAGAAGAEPAVDAQQRQPQERQ